AHSWQASAQTTRENLYLHHLPSTRLSSERRNPGLMHSAAQQTPSCGSRAKGKACRRRPKQPVSPTTTLLPRQSQSRAPESRFVAPTFSAEHKGCGPLRSPYKSTPECSTPV